VKHAVAGKLVIGGSVGVLSRKEAVAKDAPIYRASLRGFVHNFELGGGWMATPLMLALSCRILLASGPRSVKNIRGENL